MELKPCPFCGGKAEGYCRGRQYDYIECIDCGSSQSEYRHQTAEAATEAWNARASVPADPRVAELEAALEEAHRAGVSILMGAAPASEGRMTIMETWRVRELGIAMQKVLAALAGSAAQTAAPHPSGEVT